MFAELQHRDSGAEWKRGAGTQLTQPEQGPCCLLGGFEARALAQLLSSRTGKTRIGRRV